MRERREGALGDEWELVMMAMYFFFCYTKLSELACASRLPFVRGCWIKYKKRVEWRKGGDDAGVGGEREFETLRRKW